MGHKGTMLFSVRAKTYQLLDPETKSIMINPGFLDSEYLYN